MKDTGLKNVTGIWTTIFQKGRESVSVDLLNGKRIQITVSEKGNRITFYIDGIKQKVSNEYGEQG